MTRKELPSAQHEPSEITDEQAIRHLQSTGWMQNHDREMYESGLREKLADDSGSYDSLIHCEDAISRQAVLALQRNKVRDFKTMEVVSETINVTDIEALPSVEPIRPRGHWIKTQAKQGGISETWYNCSECGWRNALYLPRSFCPNCGAKMIEPQESKEDEIHVGDEVFILDPTYPSVVTSVFDDSGVKKAVHITGNGKWSVCEVRNLHKTGVRYPEIEKVLEKLCEGGIHE